MWLVAKYRTLFCIFLLVLAMPRQLAAFNTGDSLKVLEKYTANGQQNRSFELLTWLGGYELEQGNYPLALKYYFRAEDLQLNKPQKTSLYIKISKNYLAQKNHKMAGKYLDLAENNMAVYPDTKTLPQLYLLKGEFAFENYKFNQSFDLTLKALALSDEQPDGGVALEALDLLCRIYYEQGEFNLALQCARKLRKKATEMHQGVAIIKAYNSLAMIFGSLSVADSATIFVNRAMDLAQANGALNQIVKVYYTLYRLNDMWRQPVDALNYYKKYAALNDSLLSENRSREIAQLEAVKQAEKQKEVNELLLDKANLQEQQIAQKVLENKLYLIGLILFVVLGAAVAFLLLKSREANKKLLKMTLEMRKSRDKIKRTSEKLFQTNKKLVKIQAALIAQKDKAERASKAKDVFLSSVSHELRTPLTAILGLTEDLLHDTSSQESRESLEVIRFSGETLLALVNDILDYNKIQSGRIELENISFNLREYLHKQIKALKPRARKNAVSLEFQYDARLPDWLVADPVRLGQVVNNFLSNAIKFTHNGKVSLRVAYLSSENDVFFFQITVADEGIGIAPEMHAHIFERFTQASADTTRKYGGTGLGLAISKRIVELYKSTIHLQSEPGKGSSFSFALKLPKGEAQAVDKSEEMSEIQGDIHILLVEDNKVNQKLVAKAFKDIGIQIDMVSNGKQALDWLLKSFVEYDLILMDLHMPVMDGLQATAAIRKLEGYFQTVPIVGLSGSTQKDRAELLALGLTAFMQKPFKKDALFKLIAELLIKS